MTKIFLSALILAIPVLSQAATLGSANCDMQSPGIAPADRFMMHVEIPNQTTATPNENIQVIIQKQEHEMLPSVTEETVSMNASCVLTSVEPVILSCEMYGATKIASPNGNILSLSVVAQGEHIQIQGAHLRGSDDHEVYRGQCVDLGH